MSLRIARADTAAADRPFEAHPLNNIVCSLENKQTNEKWCFANESFWNYPNDSCARNFIQTLTGSLLVLFWFSLHLRETRQSKRTKFINTGTVCLMPVWHTVYALHAMQPKANPTLQFIKFMFLPDFALISTQNLAVPFAPAAPWNLILKI